MNLSIGNKIKALRKEHGITQEQLADSVGISFQAISKWENNITLPDITLVPILAGYFNITIDELFDFNLKEIRKNVDEICREACKYRENDPGKSRALLEEGLRKYPDNDILLDNLLYVLNYAENPDETISVAGKLTEQASEPGIKYDALRFMAYAYHAKGEISNALAAIRQLPEIDFTKLTEIAFLLTGKPKYEAAEKQKWISFENLLQMMVKITEYYEETGDIPAALSETKRALRLLSVMEEGEKNSDFRFYSDYLCRHMERLKLLGKDETTLSPPDIQSNLSHGHSPCP